MSKKVPARRADSRLSNLVLEGGKSQRYDPSQAGEQEARTAGKNGTWEKQAKSGHSKK